MNSFLSRKSTKAMLEDRRSRAAKFHFYGICPAIRWFAAANFKKPRFSLGTYGARLADEYTRNLCNCEATIPS